MKPEQSRIALLDALRGVAILMVVIYHYFGRWTDAYGPALYPYRNTFAEWPIASDGFVGVLLFFIVSGFVISLSLQRSASLADFLARRADRLVLPMLVISCATFIGLWLLPTPTFEVRFSDFLPSWTFTAPQAWQWLDPQVDYIDGVYWTLFVEVRFYAIFAIFWFVSPGRGAVRLVGAFAVGGLLAYAAALVTSSDRAALLLDIVAFPPFACLFASGVVYSRIGSNAVDREDVALLALLIPASLLGCLLAGFPTERAVGMLLWCALFHAVFLAMVTGKRGVNWIAAPSLVALGTVSYSLYLAHQRLGVALIHRVPVDWPLSLQMAAVFFVLAAMVTVAFASHRLIERRHLFSSALRRLTAGAARPSPDAVGKQSST
jgi:peptidoglycan/LPS O-acetylase OafA/YrhL